MANKSLKHNEEQLQHYVEVMISKGFSEGAIIKGLKKKGWSLAVIKKATKLAKLKRKKKQAEVVHNKKVEKNNNVKEDYSKVDVSSKKPPASKPTMMQLFFFIIFLASVGGGIYSFLKGMWIAMGLISLLAVLSFFGFRLKSSKKEVVDDSSGNEKYEVKRKYREALKIEGIRKKNLREIMRKKHEEERYLKKIERIKKREERLKRKQDMKAKSKDGKTDFRLRRIEKKTDKLKEIETKLQGELDRIGEKKEILEKGGKLGATGKDETDLDQLYNYIQKYGKIKLYEVTSMFAVPKKIATEWMRILEDYQLAEVYYPAVGSPELRKCKK